MLIIMNIINIIIITANLICREFLDANIDDHQIYIISWREGKDEPKDRYALFPVGLVFEVCEVLLEKK